MSGIGPEAEVDEHALLGLTLIAGEVLRDTSETDQSVEISWMFLQADDTRRLNAMRAEL